MFDNILSVEEVSVAYGAKEIVHGVSFNLRRGEILAIVGESGSGKSTILKAINGLGGVVTDGQIFFDGREITNLDDNSRRKISGESIGMIFRGRRFVRCAKLARRFLKVSPLIKIGLMLNLKVAQASL